MDFFSGMNTNEIINFNENIPKYIADIYVQSCHTYKFDINLIKKMI